MRFQEVGGVFVESLAVMAEGWQQCVLCAFGMGVLSALAFGGVALIGDGALGGLWVLSMILLTSSVPLWLCGMLAVNSLTSADQGGAEPVDAFDRVSWGTLSEAVGVGVAINLVLGMIGVGVVALPFASLMAISAALGKGWRASLDQALNLFKASWVVLVVVNFAFLLASTLVCALVMLGAFLLLRLNSDPTMLIVAGLALLGLFIGGATSYAAAFHVVFYKRMVASHELPPAAFT
jgi:hypothetical protein